MVSRIAGNARNVGVKDAVHVEGAESSNQLIEAFTALAADRLDAYAKNEANAIFTPQPSRS